MSPAIFKIFLALEGVGKKIWKKCESKKDRIILYYLPCRSPSCDCGKGRRPFIYVKKSKKDFERLQRKRSDCQYLIVARDECIDQNVGKGKLKGVEKCKSLENIVGRQVIRMERGNNDSDSLHNQGDSTLPRTF